MDKNTKILSFLSFIAVLIGCFLLWFGLKPISQNILTPSVTPTIIHQESRATSSAVVGVEGQKIKVIKVVDGDTFEIEGGQKVRLIGVDTPETVDPRRPVGCFGKEASNNSKNLLEGREVILQKDVSDTDKFGRLLRLVYLPIEDGKILFVNDYLVREGFAKVSTFPPDVKFVSQFLQAEKFAKENKKGLWEMC